MEINEEVLDKYGIIPWEFRSYIFSLSNASIHDLVSFLLIKKDIITSANNEFHHITTEGLVGYERLKIVYKHYFYDAELQVLLNDAIVREAKTNASREEMEKYEYIRLKKKYGDLV